MCASFYCPSIPDQFSSASLAFPLAQTDVLADPDVTEAEAVGEWIGDVEGLAEGITQDQMLEECIYTPSKPRGYLTADRSAIYRNGQLRGHLGVLARALGTAGQNEWTAEARKLLEHNGGYSNETPFAEVSRYLSALRDAPDAIAAIAGSREALAELGVFFRATIAQPLFDPNALSSVKLVQAQFERLQQGGASSPLHPFRRAVDVDYRTIAGSHRIVYFGEICLSPSSRREMEENVIPILKGLGFTHMALCVFNSGGPIEEHLRDPDFVEEKFVIDHEQFYHNADPEACQISYDQAEEMFGPYVEIARRAFAAGLAPMPLDLRIDASTRPYFWKGPERSRLSCRPHYDDVGWNRLQALHLWGVRQFLGQVKSLDEMSSWVFECALPQRAFHAAGILSKFLKEDSRARIAVLAGRDWCGSWRDLRKSASLNALVARMSGVRGPVVHFSLPETNPDSRPRVGYDSARLVSELAVAAGLSSRRMMQVKESTLLSAAHHFSDWVVYLP